MLSFHLSRARIQAPVPNFTCKRGFGKQSPSLVYVEQENHWQAAFLPQLQNMAQAQAAGVCGVIQQGFREVCRERASPRSRNADQCHASRPESHPTLPSVKETPLCSEPRVLLCCQTAHKEGRPLALPSVPFPMPQPQALLSQCESRPGPGNSPSQLWLGLSPTTAYASSKVGKTLTACLCSFLGLGPSRRCGAQSRHALVNWGSLGCNVCFMEGRG